MLIKCPKVVYSKDNKPCKLYVDYRPNKENIWEWFITYVGDNEILYRKSDRKLSNIEDDLFEFIKVNDLIVD